jgi:hypothetical protein
LAYGVEHLTAAVVTLASGEGTLATRLQACWTENVQMVWMKPCLTPPMLVEFRSLWERYTAPSDDPHSTVLREMGTAELATAARDVVELAFAAAAVAATSSPDGHLA